MKVIFICGGLEPGKDGVGDYVMLLATQLTKLGHHAAIVSMNDSHIKKDIEQTHSFEGVVIDTLRISAISTEEIRFEAAVKWIESIKPDILSLQFVPYSFNKKGLPYSFSKRLKTLKNYKWHIMFHELWLDKPEKTTQYIVATLQKYIVKKIVKTVKPYIVNTSITHNRSRLKSIGVNATVLGLFGNILKSETNQVPTSFDQETAGSIKILYFGGVPRGNYLSQVVDGLDDFCIKTAANVSIIVISGESAQKADFIEILKSHLPAGKINIFSYSNLATDVVSSIISNSSVGIARSEPNMLGKSGSAIAMLEHGLPLWLPKWQPGDVLEYDFRKEIVYPNLAEAVNNIQESKKQYYSLLPQIVEQFCNQLK